MVIIRVTQNVYQFIYSQNKAINQVPHLFMFHLLPVISNKLDGGMLNQITKCVAEKFIKQGKPSVSASIRNLADNSESEKIL